MKIPDFVLCCHTDNVGVGVGLFRQRNNRERGKPSKIRLKGSVSKAIGGGLVLIAGDGEEPNNCV